MVTHLDVMECTHEMLCVFVFCTFFPLTGVAGFKDKDYDGLFGCLVRTLECLSKNSKHYPCAYEIFDIVILHSDTEGWHM